VGQGESHSRERLAPAGRNREREEAGRFFRLVETLLKDAVANGVEFASVRFSFFFGNQAL
jgi:hypothetical protein